MTNPTPDRYRWSYNGVTFDFYRLCEILGITHQAQAHALKKVIRAGRSIKPVTQDIDETIDALRRWKEMIGEDKNVFQTCPNCGAENAEWKPEPGGEIRCCQCCAQYILPNNPEDKTYWSYKPISIHQSGCVCLACETKLLDSTP